MQKQLTLIAVCATFIFVSSSTAQAQSPYQSPYSSGSWAAVNWSPPVTTVATSPIHTGPNPVFVIAPYEQQNIATVSPAPTTIAEPIPMPTPPVMAQPAVQAYVPAAPASQAVCLSGG